jgi:hypothetical protein
MYRSFLSDEFCLNLYSWNIPVLIGNRIENDTGFEADVLPQKLTIKFE